MDDQTPQSVNGRDGDEEDGRYWHQQLHQQHPARSTPAAQGSSSAAAAAATVTAAATAAGGMASVRPPSLVSAPSASHSVVSQPMAPDRGSMLPINQNQFDAHEHQQHEHQQHEHQQQHFHSDHHDGFSHNAQPHRGELRGPSMHSVGISTSSFVSDASTQPVLQAIHDHYEREVITNDDTTPHADDRISQAQLDYNQKMAAQYVMQTSMQNEVGRDSMYSQDSFATAGVRLSDMTEPSDLASSSAHSGTMRADATSATNSVALQQNAAWLADLALERKIHPSTRAGDEAISQPSAHAHSAPDTAAAPPNQAFYRPTPTRFTRGPDQDEADQLLSPDARAMSLRRQRTTFVAQPGAMAIAGPQNPDDPISQSRLKGRLTPSRPSAVRPNRLSHAPLATMHEEGAVTNPRIDTSQANTVSIQNMEHAPGTTMTIASPNNPHSSTDRLDTSAQMDRSGRRIDDSRGSVQTSAYRDDGDEESSSPTKEGSSQNYIYIGIVVLVIVIGAIIGAVVGLGGSNSSPQKSSTNPPTSPPSVSNGELKADLRATLSTITPPNHPAWANPQSAQSKALDWIVTSDSFLESTNVMSQRYVLAVFYYSLDGENWSQSNNFLSAGTPECDWNGVADDGVITGVQCNPKGNVQIIRMSSNDLRGTIPSELEHFANSMDEFVAMSNIIQGNPFTVLTKLTKLKTIVISSNRDAEGKMPSDLNQLTQLEELNFQGCSMSGSFPSDMGTLLTDLEIINARSNSMTGTFPFDSFNQPSSKLSTALLFGNNIRGNLTDNLPLSLERLDLSRNELTGNLPTQLSSWMNLKSLALSENDFEGNIPSQLGLLKDLELLDLVAAGIDGAIPSQLGDLAKLTALRLGSNELTSSLPTDLGRLAKLQQFFVDGNVNLGGVLPTQLANLNSLVTGLFQFTNITGDFELLCSIPSIFQVIVQQSQTPSCSCCQML